MAKRILFVTSTRVGDAILSTGLLNRLLTDNPGARVTVACGPAAASLFAAVPGLERVIVLDKMLYSLHWLYLWWQCGRRLWDEMVDLRNSPMTYLIPARRRHRMGRTGAGHRLERLAEVMGVEGPPPEPKLWASEADRAQATKLIPDGGPVLAIGPTANWRAKTWRQEHFAELVDRLSAPDGLFPGCRVAVFGRDDERPTVLRFIEGIPLERRIDLVGRVSLLEAFACMERASLYIGNDSGLMHLAAASGTPTLGLFGPSLDELYAPWGQFCDVVRGAGFKESFPENFDHRTSDSLMDCLTVDMAEDAVRKLWKRVTEAAA